MFAGLAAALFLPRNRRSQVMNAPLSLVAEWPLSAEATLGSSVRTKGIEREVRAHLPWPVKKHLKAETGRLILRMAEDDAEAFQLASATISQTVETIDALPVLPREVEDILAISSRERHKWLKDGRLQSACTRTVKIRGRSKAVTFHVFDPKHIEEVLDRDLPNIWRDHDADEAAQNRRRGANKAARTRAGNSKTSRGDRKDSATGTELKEWDAFEDEGLLR